MRVPFRTLALLSILAGAGSAPAQDAVRLVENFPAGYQYHVSCRVEINGTLPLPEMKTKQLTVSGKSAIEYDERILKENAARQIERTVRSYGRLDFERKIGDEEQQNALRPEVSRLVILRHKQYEVPFAPSGPLTWGEIDLVRTDVFTPALRGLLPPGTVKIGDRWQASAEAVQELTDLEQVTEGTLNCTFDSITTLVGRRQARISFQGRVAGIGEDGKASHQLDGQLYFDLDGNYLAYLYVKGSHLLPAQSGQAPGKIEGSFTLTRTPLGSTGSAALSDESLRGLNLEPGDANTLLLYDNAKLGLRFTYPRNWRVAGTNGRQLGLDENRGSGLLLVAETATMSTQQFQQEVKTWLTKEKATVYRIDPIKTLSPGIEVFAVDAEVAKERATLQYYVLQQPAGSVTITARLVQRDLAQVGREVEAIARSVQLSRPTK